MCGRYVEPAKAPLEVFWKIARREWDSPRQRFNVAPTTSVPIVLRAEDGAYELRGARWGLIPHWWRDAKPPTISFNARSEEAAVKPTWRDSYHHSRCLMLAQGWYAWSENEPAREGAPKGRCATGQPYYMHCEADPVIAIAGLLAYWRSPAGDAIVSCALLSRDAAPSLVRIHHRMPAILPAESFESWLTHETDEAEVARMVAGARSDFVGRPVSIRVNNTRNDSPDLIEDISREWPAAG